jgi:hypothetical protein
MDFYNEEVLKTTFVPEGTGLALPDAGKNEKGRSCHTH